MEHMCFFNHELFSLNCMMVFNFMYWCSQTKYFISEWVYQLEFT